MVRYAHEAARCTTRVARRVRRALELVTHRYFCIQINQSVLTHQQTAKLTVAVI